jgi:putative ABC transport system substrate-binding protein
MTSSADAVTQGLVASLARPGGNVTGLTNISNDLAGKPLELLKESFPGISRVTALSCPASGGAVGDRRSMETEAAAHDLKIQLQTVMVSGPGELDSAMHPNTSASSQSP